MRRLVRCAAAVIVRDGHVLAAQRGYGPYKDGWEFPGGKIEENETGAQAVVRELKEEMDYAVRPLRLLKEVDCAYEDFDLALFCYLCVPEEQHYDLKEHENAEWLKMDELDQVNWLAADRILVDAIMQGTVSLEVQR
jgi:8-oxo-dGTP diphosphatase